MPSFATAVPLIYGEPQLENFKFTTQQSRYRKSWVLEVLVNGSRFGASFPFDQNFRFGREKAAMFLPFKSTIETFFGSGGTLPGRSVKPVVSTDFGLIRCLPIKSFQKQNGVIVKKPYLRFERGGKDIGVGVTKSQALLSVWDDLEYFVNER